jgi:hypothetical protein
VSQVLWRSFQLAGVVSDYSSTAPLQITTYLTDGAPGDTTTHANGQGSGLGSVSDNQTSYGAPMTLVVEAIHELDAPAPVTGYSFVAGLGVNGSGVTAGSYVVETSPGGEAWTQRAAGSLPIGAAQAMSGSLAGIGDVQRVRVRIVHQRSSFGSPQFFADLFDFRLTSDPVDPAQVTPSGTATLALTAAATVDVATLVRARAALSLAARAAVCYLPCPARRRPGCGGTPYRRRGH